MTYWIYRDGRPVGPLTAEQVLALATPETPVSHNREWVPLDQHPDFAHIATAISALSHTQPIAFDGSAPQREGNGPRQSKHPLMGDGGVTRQPARSLNSSSQQRPLARRVFVEQGRGESATRPQTARPARMANLDSQSAAAYVNQVPLWVWAAIGIPAQIVLLFALSFVVTNTVSAVVPSGSAAPRPRSTTADTSRQSWGTPPRTSNDTRTSGPVYRGTYLSVPLPQGSVLVGRSRGMPTYQAPMGPQEVHAHFERVMAQQGLAHDTGLSHELSDGWSLGYSGNGNFVVILLSASIPARFTFAMEG